MIGRFGRSPTEIGEARRLVRSSLHSWGFAAEVPALELAVSELVTNAVQYGDGDLEVQLTATGTNLRLQVLDHGQDAATPAPRETPAGEFGGWGLRLVDELSDSWGAVVGHTETRVWMERDAAPGGTETDGHDVRD